MNRLQNKLCMEMDYLLPTKTKTVFHNSPMTQLSAKKCVAVILPLLLVILVPYLHIGVFYLKFWVPNKQPVNKDMCKCSCFDTIFKGSYEKPGNSGYKHVYFNATQNTMKIWTVTVVFMGLFYESLKYLITLVQTQKCRLVWAAVFLVNIYPNYYSWWMLFGYYNDEFYHFLSHQIFFCVTELFVSGLVLTFCNKDTEPSSWKLLVVASISFVHIFVSGLDQFVANIFQGQGAAFQNFRDVGLMIPDLLHLTVAWYYYLVKYCSSSSSSCLTMQQDRIGVMEKASRNSRRREVVLNLCLIVFLIALSHMF